jgi:hypothetical protein
VAIFCPFLHRINTLWSVFPLLFSYICTKDKKDKARKVTRDQGNVSKVIKARIMTMLTRQRRQDSRDKAANKTEIKLQDSITSQQLRDKK